MCNVIGHCAAMLTIDKERKNLAKDIPEDLKSGDKGFESTGNLTRFLPANLNFQISISLNRRRISLLDGVFTANFDEFSRCTPSGEIEPH